MNAETTKTITPGPWAIHVDPRRSSHMPLVGTDAETPLILAKVCGGIGAGSREANARLIAAAPDLLAALREFVDTCEQAPPTELIARIGAVCITARRALAKAGV